MEVIVAYPCCNLHYCLSTYRELLQLTVYAAQGGLTPYITNYLHAGSIYRAVAATLHARLC